MLFLWPFGDDFMDTLKGKQIIVPFIMFIGISPWMAGEIQTIDFLLLCMLPMLLAKLIGAISVDLFSYKNLVISKNNI